MGYTTYFNGSLKFNKDVTIELQEYINRFSNTRRMPRDNEKIKEIYPNWKELCFFGYSCTAYAGKGAFRACFFHKRKWACHAFRLLFYNIFQRFFCYVQARFFSCRYVRGGFYGCARNKRRLFVPCGTWRKLFCVRTYTRLRRFFRVYANGRCSRRYGRTYGQISALQMCAGYLVRCALRSYR